MVENWCTCLPDSLHFGWMSYDIGGICLLHDRDYEVGIIPRKQADSEFYSRLMAAYPEYSMLWGIVYEAVRRSGWIFWYLHRIKNITRFEIKFFRAQGKAKIKNEIQLAINRYGISAIV